MSSAASPSSELQEAAKRLKSKDLKTQGEGMRQVITLFAQGENCIAAQSCCAAITHEDNASMHRFANILNQEYAVETGTVTDVVDGIVTNFEKSNNLIKGLAVKQAGFFVSQSTADKLIPIIIQGAKSPDPYLRKTAALAILRVHHRNSAFLDQFNLLSVLQDLLTDSNPNVCANAIAAITEIGPTRKAPLVDISVELVKHLLSIIQDAHEWAQVQILDFVGRLGVQLTPDDTESILRDLYSRLVQANPAITMAAIRCFFRLRLAIHDRDHLMRQFRKLMTLMTSGKEIQYTVLRSICVLKQKYQSLFVASVDAFSCKYDDEIYIKLAKLDLILMFTTEENMTEVLRELNRYAKMTSEDERFVEKSIRAIGRLALCFPAIAERCVDCLATLMKTGTPAAVQECIVVSVNLLRKYQDQCDKIISGVCNVCIHDDLDHRAKAAMVWIFGEYSEKINGAADFINRSFLENYVEESTDVQLAILSAIVKLFVKSDPHTEPLTQDMLKKVLSLAISGVDNPDLNDRAHMYLWLLKDCPNEACEIVRKLHEPGLGATTLGIFEPKLVEALVPQIGTLAVLYGKFPAEFVPSARPRSDPPPPPRQVNPAPPPRMIKMEMQEADTEQSFESQYEEEDVPE